MVVFPIGVNASESLALKWLSAQSEHALLKSYIATELQVASEIVLLSNFGEKSLSEPIVDSLSLSDSSTEALAHLAIVYAKKNRAFIGAISQIMSRQNSDGGLGHIDGWESNLSDTSWFLLAIHQTGAINSVPEGEKKRWMESVKNALSYIANHPKAGVDIAGSRHDSLYVNAITLQVLTTYAGQNTGYFAVINKLIQYLKEKKISDANWDNGSEGLITNAIVSRALHPYQKNDANFKDFAKQAYSQQMANGSWNNDSFTTAVVLQSLQTQSSAVLSPIKSSLSLRVVDGETNLPLSGATLFGSTGDKNTISPISNGVGKIDIKDLKPGDYSFRLSKKGYVSVDLNLNLKSGQLMNVGDIKLSRASDTDLPQIQGVVTKLKSDDPINKAVITLTPLDKGGELLQNEKIVVETNEKGAYQIVLKKPSGFFIEVKKQNFHTVKANGFSKKNGVTVFNTKLEMIGDFNAKVLGKVLGSNGLPIEGVEIRSLNEILATTNSSGDFDIKISKKTNLSLEVKKSGYQDKSFNLYINQSGDFDLGSWVLKKASVQDDSDYTGKLSIKVVDQKTKKSINSAVVELELLNSNGSVSQKKSFVLQNAEKTIPLQNGKWRVTIFHPAYDKKVEVVVIKKNTLLKYTSYLKPLSENTLSRVPFIILSDKDKKPISGAELSFEVPGSGRKLKISDANGLVDLNNIPAGNYSFKLTKSKYRTLRFNFYVEPNKSYKEKIVLLTVKDSNNSNENSKVNGKVVDKKTGNAIHKAKIEILNVQSGEKSSVFSGSDGKFSLILAGNVRFKLMISRSSYITQKMEGYVGSGETLNQNVEMVKSKTIKSIVKGVVVDENGKGVFGASVIQNGEKVASTIEKGVFSFHAKMIGQQQIQVIKSDYENRVFKIIVDNNNYDVGRLVIKKLKNDNPFNITSKILVAPVDSRSKKAIKNALVKVDKIVIKNGQYKYIETQTFTSGGEPEQIKIPLEKGNWRLTVSHPLYSKIVKIFELKNGSSVNYSPNMNMKKLSLKGQVFDSITDAPLKNVLIKVVDSQTQSLVYIGRTNELGEFKTVRVIGSQYVDLIISPDRYLPTKRFINVSSVYNEDRDVVDLGEIRLRPVSANNLLPDLKIKDVVINEVKTDKQALKVKGYIDVVFLNLGKSIVKNKKIKITIFEDKNYNKKRDSNEQVYGDSVFVGDVPIQTDNESPKYESVKISIQGDVKYSLAPMAVVLDSENVVSEINEDNNFRLTSDSAEIKPSKGTMESLVAWKADYISDSTPVAAPLSDTNGDGIIGYGDVSSIVVLSSDGYKILDGKTGRLKFTLPSCGSQETAAIGDVDNDNLPEIIVKACDGIHVYSNKGELQKKLKGSAWSSGWANYARDPVLADLDKDGAPEIILNRSIYSYESGVLQENLLSGDAQFVADVDGDGYLDIVGNSGVVDRSGKLLYKFKNSSGYNIDITFAAIGDVFGGSPPQIIAVYLDYIYIYDAKTGKRINYYATIGSSGGGSPVIADFDGDGISDIGFAQSYQYLVLRGDGSVIWSTPIQDSSGGTGSTVFDFDNDGNTEAVHFDEKYLRIYDAKTGKDRIKVPNATWTAHEYPIVGDFDADGHADIVITSHSSDGIRMISSKNKDWANTRNIWNQYSYHVTNVNDDLTIPKNEPNSWEVHNTYRANLLLTANATAASDLTASYIKIKDYSTTGQSELTARIGNAGGKPVPAGMPVSFYRVPKGSSGAELLGVVALSKKLLGGDINKSYEDVTLKYSGSLADFGELVVVANDAGAGLDSTTGIPANSNQASAKIVQEFTRKNNTARLTINGDWVALTLLAKLDKNIYTANEDVSITSKPTNLGSFAVDAIVKTQIIDSAGNVISTLPNQTVALGSALKTKPENSKTITQVWNTKTRPVGNYQARISLYKGDNFIVSVDKPFAILANGLNTGLTDGRISTDKQRYQTQDIVMLTSRVRNTASNAVAGQRDVFLEVTDPNNEVIWQQTYSHKNMVANAIKDKSFVLNLADAKLGAYKVTQTIITKDGSQPDQKNSTRFVVDKISLAGLMGAITPNKTIVEIGDNAVFNWQVTNSLNTEFNNLPARIELFKQNSKNAFKRIDLPKLSLAKGKSVSGLINWQTEGDDKDKITAILIVNIDNEDKGIATTEITLKEPPVEISINQVDAITEPLLVYYSCTSGWNTFAQNWSLGKFNYPCFDSRAGYMKDYLNRIGVPYKMVKTPWAFRHELQSGKFRQVWLLGAIEKLTPHTFKELRETAYMGDNVLVDSGMRSWLNHHLYHFAGVNYRGRLQLALPKHGGGKLSLAPPLFTAPVNPEIVDTPLRTQTNRKGYPLNSNWAILLEPQMPDTAFNKTQTSASFNGAQKLDLFLEWLESTRKGHEDNYYNQQLRAYPAIVSSSFGNGEPVALAFDLINGLTLATSTGENAPDLPAKPAQLRWDGVLTQLLQPRRKQVLTHLPLEPVRVPVAINNKSSKAKEFVISIDLPAGAVWLDNQGGVQIADAVIPNARHIQGNHSYSVTVPAKTTVTQLPTFRLPNLAGAHSLTITVSAKKQNGDLKLLAKQENRYNVMSLSDQINSLQSSINGWSIFGKDGFQVLNLKVQMGLIKSHLKSGAYELAVYEAARMSTTFSEMKQTDTRDIHSLRIQGDELLRALQMQWYVRRNNTYPAP